MDWGIEGFVKVHWVQKCGQEGQGLLRKGGRNLTQVTDLGAVLHMVGGTAASFMIFFLPGLLLMNAAIVKTSAQVPTACVYFLLPSLHTLQHLLHGRTAS